MNNLIKLELKKTAITPYLWAALAITLSMIGFLYTFSLIAYTGNDLDAAEFSSYHNIFALTSALNMTAHSILAAVMFSRFLLKDYSDKSALLLFSYPIDRKSVLHAKTILVAAFCLGSMMTGTAVMYLVYGLTEAMFPLVNDTFSLSLFMRFAADTLLYSATAIFIGMISLRIGFIKKSVQTTIVTTVIICCCMANVVATTSNTNVFFILAFGVIAAVTIFVFQNLSKSIERMEV